MNEQAPQDKPQDKDAAKDEAAAKPTHEEVAKKAYSLSRKEGRAQGSAEEKWLEAEAQLQHAGSGPPQNHYAR